MSYMEELSSADRDLIEKWPGSTHDLIDIHQVIIDVVAADSVPMAEHGLSTDLGDDSLVEYAWDELLRLVTAMKHDELTNSNQCIDAAVDKVRLEGSRV